MTTFSESKIIKQVTLLPATQSIQVQWANVVMRDDVVISESFERKAYEKEQWAEFEAEVDGAAKYMDAIGW